MHLVYVLEGWSKISEGGINFLTFQDVICIHNTLEELPSDLFLGDFFPLYFCLILPRASVVILFIFNHTVPLETTSFGHKDTGSPLIFPEATSSHGFSKKNNCRF